MRRAFRPVQIMLADEGVSGLHVHCLNESAAFRGSLSRSPAGRTAQRRSLRATRHRDSPRGSIMLRDCELGAFDTAYAYRFGPASHEVTRAALLQRRRPNNCRSMAFPAGRSAALFAPDLTAEIVDDERGRRCG